MKILRYFIVVSCMLLLTACGLSTTARVNKQLKHSTEDITSGDYCSGLKKLQYALNTAESGRRQKPVETVLQNFVSNYNTVMQKVASINSQSDIASQRLKADTWACWIPAMQEVAPKMSASLKGGINPAFTVDRITLQEVTKPLSQAFHERALKQDDKKQKFYDLLMSYYYDSKRPDIVNEVQNAYANATWHIIINNTGEKYIDGTPILANYIIPEIKRSIKVETLATIKSNIPASYDSKNNIYDIQYSPQKKGNNVIVTLKGTSANRTSRDFTRDIPVERTATEQYCYDVDVYYRDDEDEKKRKPKIRRETERRCDDRTYTYTETTQESGVANNTDLSGLLSVSVNGRSVVKNKTIYGTGSVENTSKDIDYAANQFAQHVYEVVERQIQSSR